MNDILTTIRLHLPEDNLCFASFSKLKENVSGIHNTPVKLIEYCEICHALWPDNEDVTECSTPSCYGYIYLNYYKLNKYVLPTVCLSIFFEAFSNCSVKSFLSNITGFILYTDLYILMLFSTLSHFQIYMLFTERVTKDQKKRKSKSVLC